MAASIRFLLSNRIENTTIVDRIADFCLAPARGIMQLCGRPVKVYYVYFSDRTISDETPFVLKTKCTLRKVIKYVLYFVFMIPATLIGLGLKKIALCNGTLYRKMTVLFHQINAPPGVKEEKLKVLIFPASGTRPALIDTITLKILTLLAEPYSVARMRCISRSFLNGINKHQAFLVSHFRSQYQGLPKALTASSLTFRGLNINFRDQEAYFDYSKQLYMIFGGRENFLRYPVIETVIVPARTLNEIAFSSPSPIIRVRDINPENSYVDEFIIVKFTAYLRPYDMRGTKNFGEGSIYSRGIVNWRDYLVLKYAPFSGWKAHFDSREEGFERVHYTDREGTLRTFLKEKNNDFWERTYPDLEFLTFYYDDASRFDGSELNLRNLVLHGSAVYFDRENPPYHLQGNQFAFRRIEVFENFPIVLGHVENLTIKKTQIPFPDFLQQENGDWVPNPDKYEGDPDFVTKWEIVK